jgi:ribosomal-protein-alanine N-acetyltransferase
LRGCSKIKHLCGHPDNLHYKIAELADFEDFYMLKSEPNNIFWSGFTDAPDKEGFKSHYQKELERDDRTIIFLYINNEIAGYVAISFDNINKTTETAHGVVSNFGGRGLGKKLIKYAVEYSIEKIPQANNIIGWIAEDNVGSIKNVLGNGYAMTDEFEFRSFQQLESKIKFNKYIRALK